MTTINNNNDQNNNDQDLYDKLDLTKEEKESIIIKNDFRKFPYVVVWIEERNKRMFAFVSSIKKARKLIGKSEFFWIYDDFDIFDCLEKIG